MSALLAWQDYRATGSVDLFRTYEARLHERTQVGLVDSSGLVNTSTGRHIVGWDPAPTRDMFVDNDHTSVCNAWAIGGLAALAEMAKMGGYTTNSTVYTTQAAAIKAAMLQQMWDAGQKRFRDGPCAEPAVSGHGGVTTNYFTLYHGLVPKANIQDVWAQITAFGLTLIGDYGAHVFINALAQHAVDDGTAMLTALTKCDASSWCNEIRTYNATMTSETLGAPHATMSHPWGTAPISGIVHGIMGVQQTAAAWDTFTVRPLLASLGFANMTVPTIRGPIVVAAAPGWLSVVVPCNTAATLCVQPIPSPGAGGTPYHGSSRPPPRLLLDGLAVSSVATRQHLCAAVPVRCAAHPRVLSVV